MEGKRVSHPDIWGKKIQIEGTSAKSEQGSQGLGHLGSYRLW